MQEREEDRDYNRSRSRDRDNDWNTEHNYRDEGNENPHRQINDDNPEDSHSQPEEGSNLYVTKLSFETTEDDLREIFSKYGEVTNVSIVKEPVTFNSRGFGFVAFKSAADADRAIEGISGTILHGREVKVEKARRTTGYAKTPGRYLGPPQMSTKRGGNDRDHPSRRGPPPPRNFDREYGRGPPIDRYDRDPRGPPTRSSYRDDRYPPSREYPPAGYGYDRDYVRPPAQSTSYRDRPPVEYDHREPPPIARTNRPIDYAPEPRRYDYDDRRALPPRDDARRSYNSRDRDGYAGFPPGRY